MRAEKVFPRYKGEAPAEQSLRVPAYRRWDTAMARLSPPNHPADLSLARRFVNNRGGGRNLLVA